MVVGSERELVDRILARLSPHFGFEREVRGIGCRGVAYRLDAVLWPHDPNPWHDHEPKLGLEVKAFNGGTNQITKAVAQAFDYKHAVWKGHGSLTIFHFPPLGAPGYVRGQGAEMEERGFLGRVLAQLGVGDLRGNRLCGPSFWLNSDHCIWSEKRGVEEGSRTSLVPRWGSAV